MTCVNGLYLYIYSLNIHIYDKIVNIFILEPLIIYLISANVIMRANGSDQMGCLWYSYKTIKAGQHYGNRHPQ